MAGDLGRLEIKLLADIAQFTSDMGRAAHVFESSIHKMQRAFFALRGAVVAATSVAGMGAFVAAASEAQQASNRLTAVLNATGYAAGVSKTEIDELADSLAKSTPFDDESIRAAAATLLKFGNIQQEVFKEALKLSTDYAAATKTEVSAAAQTLGKALASPTEGLTALEREFGKLHPAQRKMIEDMAESGRRLQAQAEILTTVKEKIGGTAETMNTGYLRATTGVTKAWNEFVESLGKTATMGRIVENVLKGITGSLDSLKAVIEAPWVAKIPTFLFGPLPKPPDLGGEEGKKAAGLTAAREQEWARGMAEQNERIRKFISERAEKAAKENAERAKRLRAEDIRGWVAHAEWVFQQAEEEALALAKINENYWAQVEKMRQLDLQGWVAYAEVKMQQAYDEASALAQIADDAAKKAQSAARELGMTFTSAFEDAVIAGKKLSDVLKGLAQDLARIFFRKSVTEPLATAASGLITDLMKGWFTSRAGGGPVSRPTVVGEHGPELFVPQAFGSITPNRQLAEAATTVNVNLTIQAVDARSVAQLIATPPAQNVIVSTIRNAFHKRLRSSPV